MICHLTVFNCYGINSQKNVYNYNKIKTRYIALTQLYVISVITRQRARVFVSCI